MSKFGKKASEPQISAASDIERGLAKLKEMAEAAELRFLLYLLEMAQDEAMHVAKGALDFTEGAATLLPTGSNSQAK